MKKIHLYIVPLMVVILAGCTKNDPFEGTLEVFDPPVFAGNTPTDLKVKAMFDKYGVIFKPVFDHKEYTWDWDKTIPFASATATSGTRYTPADLAYALPVMDSVDKWVFNIFPYEFSKARFPRNILLVDTLTQKYLLGANIVQRIREGNVTTNYILLSYVSARFDQQKAKRMLRESWLSLFMEKMLVNSPAIPAAFVNTSSVGFAKGSFTNTEDVTALYAILKKSRLKQNSGSATAAWPTTTPAQDFSDFVAFIVFTPESEKQTVYAKNSGVLAKVNLVKDYFATNFNVRLPYIPTAP